jgi:hypothetical protein
MQYKKEDKMFLIVGLIALVLVSFVAGVIVGVSLLFI